MSRIWLLLLGEAFTRAYLFLVFIKNAFLSIILLLMRLLIKSFFNFAIVVLFIASVSPCAYCVETASNSVNHCCDESSESSSNQSDGSGVHCVYCEFGKCGEGQDFSDLNIKTNAELETQNFPPQFVGNNFSKLDLSPGNPPINKSKIAIGSYHSKDLCIKNCRFLI